MIASFAKECKAILLMCVYICKSRAYIRVFLFSKGRNVKMERSQLVIRWLELAFSLWIGHLPN